MSREYKVVKEQYEPPYIVRVYNEPGVSWRDAKKQLRQWYLDQSHAIRALREKDVLSLSAQDAEVADQEGFVTTSV